MKYYLVRIDKDGNHRVVGDIPLTKTTDLIFDEILPSGETQYLCPEILIEYLNKVGLGITTTVKTLDKIFTYEAKPVPDDLEEGVKVETDIEAVDVRTVE